MVGCRSYGRRHIGRYIGNYLWHYIGTHIGTHFIVVVRCFFISVFLFWDSFWPGRRGTEFGAGWSDSRAEISRIDPFHEEHVVSRSCGIACSWMEVTRVQRALKEIQFGGLCRQIIFCLFNTRVSRIPVSPRPHETSSYNVPRNVSNLNICIIYIYIGRYKKGNV